MFCFPYFQCVYITFILNSSSSLCVFLSSNSFCSAWYSTTEKFSFSAIKKKKYIYLKIKLRKEMYPIRENISYNCQVVFFKMKIITEIHLSKSHTLQLEEINVLSSTSVIMWWMYCSRKPLKRNHTFNVFFFQSLKL